MTSGGAVIAPGATVNAGSEVTLTATVNAGAAAVTAGQVNFCDASAAHCTDIFLLGTVQITGNGTALLRLHPGPGPRSYKAIFAGTSNGVTVTAGSTSAVVGFSVNAALPTKTTLTSSGNPGNYTLTSTVTGLSSAVPITGSISFLDTSDGNASLATASLVAGAPVLSFLNSDNPATGNSALSPVIADFNGDGFADVAIANDSDSTISIELGKGDGTFTAPPTGPVAAGQTPTSLAVGDFNNDGIPDLVTANVFGGYVTVLLGNGDGSFTPAQNSPISSSIQPSAVAVGDFNGDGIADVVVGDSARSVTSPSSMSVLLGKGDGTFANAAQSSVTLGDEVSSITVADFNGDGIADLAMANFGSANMNILLGQGDGTFTQAANSPITVGSYPEAVLAGDFNADGIFDLVVVNSYYTSGTPGNVSVLLGKGDGTFTAAAGSPVTVGFDPDAAALGDFNGDGKADLVVTNDDDDTLSILLGDGAGGFTQAAASPINLSVATPDPFGAFPEAAAAADFNGDGLSDFFVGNLPAEAFVFVSQLTQTATATASNILPPGTGTHLVDANFPGDTVWAPSSSATVSLTAQQQAVTVKVSPSLLSLTTAEELTVTVAVTGADSGIAPSGTVTLTSGSYTSAAVALHNGDATIDVPAGSLPAGSDTLEVSYSGDANCVAASGTASVTVTSAIPPGFTITSPAVSVAAGATTGNTSVIQITPAGGFTGNVTLTASLTSGPANAVAPPLFSFGATSPVNVTGTTPGSGLLTISTTASSPGTCSSGNSMGFPWKTTGVASLACVLLFANPRRKPAWRTLAGMLILLLCLAVGVTACSGGNGSACTNNPVTGTTAGTYTITITGVSGTIKATQTLTLTVQ